MSKVEINESGILATVHFSELDGNGEEYTPEKIVIVSYDDEYKNGIGHDSDGNAVKFDDESFETVSEGTEWENAVHGTKFVVTHGLEWEEVEEEPEGVEDEDDDEDVEDDDDDEDAADEGFICLKQNGKQEKHELFREWTEKEWAKNHVCLKADAIIVESEDGKTFETAYVENYGWIAVESQE
ncbi:MAG: hypothetical protein WC445_04880 [Patescibacteria group bacterium]